MGHKNALPQSMHQQERIVPARLTPFSSRFTGVCQVHIHIQRARVGRAGIVSIHEYAYDARVYTRVCARSRARIRARARKAHTHTHTRAHTTHTSHNDAHAHTLLHTRTHVCALAHTHTLTFIRTHTRARARGNYNSPVQWQRRARRSETSAENTVIKISATRRPLDQFQ